METLLNKVSNNMKIITQMSNREYILYQKYYDLVNINTDQLENFKHLTMDRYDVYDFMRKDYNDIKIVECVTDEQKELWKLGKTFVSVHRRVENPGRNIKFIIYINDKIAGIISLASDLLVLGVRDKYIGWSHEDKVFGNKRVNNTAVGSTIVPVQPLGFSTTGGKLLCLLLYHSDITKTWEQKYNNKLVGLSTTSLFGVNSQYNGMPKYWKTLGETAGKTNIYPHEDVYNEIREWCKINHPEEYWGIWQEQVNKKTGRKYKKSSPKNQVMNLFYKHTNFKKIWKSDNKTSLCVESKRGVYFAPLYSNTNDFLCNKIEVNDLIAKDNLDFDINDSNSIVSYWKRKWAMSRYEKKKMEQPDQFFLDISDCSNVYDFINKYQ